MANSMLHARDQPPVGRD
jgi:hypothetical protein